MADKFTVMGQEQVVGRLPDGTYGDVIRVTYRAKDADVTGTVDVGLKDYTAANVARMILERVEAHDQVADL